MILHRYPTTEIHWVGHVKNLTNKFFVRGSDCLYEGKEPKELDDRAWASDEIFDSFTEALDYLKKCKGYAKLKEMCKNENRLIAIKIYGIHCN